MEGETPIIHEPRICPLLLAAGIANGHYPDLKDFNCREEKCEWFTTRRIFIEDENASEEVSACGISFTSLKTYDR